MSKKTTNKVQVIKDIKEQANLLKGNKMIDEETGQKFYQPIVFLHEIIKVGWHKESISIPIYANKIFESPAEAAAYLSIFIRRLIDDGSLPSDVIKNNELDDSRIKTAVISVDFASIKLAADDKDIPLENL